MADYGKILGIRLRAYDLRRIRPELSSKRGGCLYPQKTLGHRDMAMTRRYVALTDRDLEKVHRTASPVQALVRSGTLSKEESRSKPFMIRQREGNG